MVTPRPIRNPPFSCVRVDVVAADFADEAERQDRADRITAECVDAGAAGVEERADARGISLFIYAPDSQLAAVAGVAESLGGVCVGAPESIVEVDWSQSWKAGFEAIVVSDRLVVRPSFVSFELKPGQREIVIDPGQAFGTGGHASTRLVLEWLDALHVDFASDLRVLDVGTGTGVLALCALALGAKEAVGFDLDPLAAREAQDFAERNGFAHSFLAFTGGIEALCGAPFDLVIANLLRLEMLPIAAELARCTRPGGRLVLSGLLASERNEVVTKLAPLGFSLQDHRQTRDATGDEWISLVMARS